MKEFHEAIGAEGMSKNMKNAYGFVEITGVTAALRCLDLMCKTAGVSLCTWERKWGGRLVTLIVKGEVAAVKEAVELAKTQSPSASGVLPNPHPEILRLISISENRA